MAHSARATYEASTAAINAISRKLCPISRSIDLSLPYRSGTRVPEE